MSLTCCQHTAKPYLIPYFKIYMCAQSVSRRGIYLAGQCLGWRRAWTKPYQNTRVGDLELRNFLFRFWSLNTVPNHGGLQLNWVTIWLRSTSHLHPLGRIACLNFELIRNQLSSDKHALLINLLSFGSYLCRFTFLMKYSCTAWVVALGGCKTFILASLATFACGLKNNDF